MNNSQQTLFADDIDVFYGRVTHSSAQVYVRINSLPGGSEWSLAGTVRGPNAPDTRTLPTTVPLGDRGEGDTLLASCSIPDPTFWTTQLPGTYNVEIQLRRDGQVIETVKRTLAIRFFGASGRNLVWESKRWVLRGVSTERNVGEEVAAFRDNAGVLVVKDPSVELLSEASMAGVLLAVELHTECAATELRRLSRWPAVAITIIPTGCDVTDNMREAATNLLFAERIEVNKASQPAAWAQVSFFDATHAAEFASILTQWPLPIVAERRLNGDYTLIEARRECDHLQRDLVSVGDFAGYVVQCR